MTFFTLNLSSTEARELSNSGESRNSQGRIGCRKFESLRTFTLPLSSSANLSVRVRFCIAYASPACKDIIDANSGDTSLLNCSRDTCFFFFFQGKICFFISKVTTSDNLMFIRMWNKKEKEKRSSICIHSSKT